MQAGASGQRKGPSRVELSWAAGEQLGPAGERRAPQTKGHKKPCGICQLWAGTAAHTQPAAPGQEEDEAKQKAGSEDRKTGKGDKGV